MTSYRAGRHGIMRRTGVLLVALVGASTVLIASATAAPASVMDLYCSFSGNVCVFQDQNQPSGGNQNEWGQGGSDGDFTDDHWAGTFDILDNEASSAANYTGCTATLHQDVGFGGSSFVLQGGYGYNSFGGFDNLASAISWAC